MKGVWGNWGFCRARILMTQVMTACYTSSGLLEVVGGCSWGLLGVVALSPLNWSVEGAYEITANLADKDLITGASWTITGAPGDKRPTKQNKGPMGAPLGATGPATSSLPEKDINFN